MSKKKTQKIIIPKGTIDPNEDTLIEIPVELKGKPVIIAQRGGGLRRSISIETSTKNVEFEGERYSEIEDSRRIRMVRNHEDDESWSPKHHSSMMEYPPEVECCLAGAIPTDMGAEDMERSFKKMQRAKQELESVALLATTGSACSRTSSRDESTVVASETIKKPKRVCLAISPSCDQSLQAKPPEPQRDLGKSSSPKGSGSIVVDSPPEVVSSSPRKGRSATQKISLDFVEGDDKRVSDKEDKDISAVCVDQVSAISSKQLKEDKEIQSKHVADETTRSDPTLPKTPTCTDCCTKHDRTQKRASLSPKTSDSCACTTERGRLSPDKLKQFYKCPNSDIDDIYVEQLKRQFDEARRKLEDAIMLASMSLKQLKTSKKYSAMLKTSLSGTSSCKQAASICDSVPEKDISFLPMLCRRKSSPPIFAKDSCKNTCPNLRESWPKVDSPSASDTLENSEMYGSTSPKRPNEFESMNVKSSIQRIIDSPCPFLKTASLDLDYPEPTPPRPYVVRKETITQTEERRCFPNFNLLKPVKKSVQSGSSSSKCSGGCIATSTRDDGSSTKFVKAPKYNFNDSDSLVGKDSSLLA